MNPLAQRIHAALPQTQCTRCGYADCAAYADALATQAAGINQCPPGGAQGIGRLARLTGRPALPLNPEHGVEGPRGVAVIDEAWCIGCTLCLDVCPTDAIVGGHKQMHTVIEPACTGCELCIPVCPVDCIQMESVTGALTGWAAWSMRQADRALQRYQARMARRNHDSATTAQNESQAASTPAETAAAPCEDAEALRKRTVVDAALARARARRAGD